MAITVAIAGITGKFGPLVATHLLKNPDVTLRGLCRDTSKVISSIASNPKVQLFQGDAYDHDKIRAFVGGSDVVICSYLGDDKKRSSTHVKQRACLDTLQVTGLMITLSLSLDSYLSRTR